MKIELTEAEAVTLLRAHAESVAKALAPTPYSAHGFGRPSNDMLRLFAAAFSHIAHGEKINAIKCVREATGLGLKEAKDLVEGRFDF